MKKIYFSFIALAVIASCSKVERQQEVKENSPLIIQAICDETTSKTTYTDQGDYYQFSWDEGDYVAVQIYKGGNSSKPDQIKFRAQSAGAATTLVQYGNTYDLTTGHGTSGYTNKDYTLGDYAFYPKWTGNNDFLYTGDGNSETDFVTLSEEIQYVDAKPTSVIPVIGHKESGDGTPNTIFKFKTATGVLKVTIKNMPAGATKLQLRSLNASDALSGSWYFTDDIYTNGVVMGTGEKETANTKSVTFSNLDGQEVVFYVPIPVGTIHGLSIDIKDESSLLYRIYNNGNIEVGRNSIVGLPAINAKKPVVWITGNSNAPTLYYTKDGTNKVARFGACISSSSTLDFSQFPTDLIFTGTSGGYYLSTWAGDGKLVSTGKYYLHWVALSEHIDANTLNNTNDSRIKAYGVIPFYFLATADGANLVGTYTATQTAADWWGSTGSHTDKVILQAEPALQGNRLMITNFRERAYDLSDNSGAHYPSDAAGTPVYGTLSGTTLTFSAASNFTDDKYFFYSGNGWYFYIVGSSTGLDGQDAPTSASSDFSFAVNTSDGVVLTNSGYIDLIFNWQKDDNWYAFWSFQNMVLTKQ